MSKKRKIAVDDGVQIRVHTNADIANFSHLSHMDMPPLKQFRGIPMHHIKIVNGQLVEKTEEEKIIANKAIKDIQRKADFIARKGAGIINWRQVLKLAISFITGFGIAWLMF
jgi:hypothetical protein